MSVNYYGKMWIATADDLNDTILREKVVQQLGPVKDRLQAHRIFASLYARYVKIVNNLGDIYDQTLQVQKRQLLEKLLMSATKRLLELQNELKEIEMSEFMYIDHTLIENKFIPHDVQLLCPYYFPFKRDSEIQNLINGVRKSAITIKKSEADKKTLKFMIEETKRKVAEETAMRFDPIEHAVNEIKRHEKARCVFSLENC